MMRKLAFLTMSDLGDFCTHDHLAIEPLASLGFEVEMVPWDRPQANWEAYEAVIIRSPWDYQQRPAEFFRVLADIDRSSARLLNGLEVARWNLNKTYLAELQTGGITIVPTRWIDGPVTQADLTTASHSWGSEQLILKPVVGANADDTFRLTPDIPHDELTVIQQRFTGRSAMLQPFVTAVLHPGEYSLFYLGGEFSHAILKTPALGDFRVQEEHGAQIQAIRPPAHLRQFADQVAKHLPFQLLYARIDLVELSPGQPAIMEVELIEPSLYLGFDPNAPRRFAHAIAANLRQPER